MDTINQTTAPATNEPAAAPATPIVETATTPATGIIDTPTQTQRPEWLPDKFKSPEDLAKSYQELSSKLGDMYGAPEDYSFEGEELDGVKLFKQVAKEQNLSQKGFEKIVNSYLEKEQAILKTVQEQIIKEIGDTRINQVKNQLKGLGLSENELKTINSFVKSKDEFAVIEKFISKINTSVTTTTGTGMGNNSIRAEIDAIRNHPNFAKNINNYRNENHQRLLDLYAQERK